MSKRIKGHTAKMLCPQCRSPLTLITEGRAVKAGFKRQRICRSCGHTFHTLEKPILADEVGPG